MEALLAMLRAAGDPTRLRLLLTLREAELTVSELTQILGQSQPRVSRHLKLLCDAGLLERFKEGSWVFYRAADKGEGGELGTTLAMLAENHKESREADRRKLSQVREARAAQAAAFFKANATEWERIRSLHAPDADVEHALVELLTEAPLESLLDAGTGTGRMLELLSPHIRRGVGVDVSADMLAIARDRLAEVKNCQVRLADIFRLPFGAGGEFDAVLFHQVLHYLDDPQTAVADAARVLKPGGRIVIVDFAPHELEFLRDEMAHRRLGFSDREVKGWFEASGLHETATRSIAPHSGSLVVKIWVGTSRVAVRGHAKAAA
jgi:ubiquinone/menaquinone biosynthesis C-methylase UbiE/DNA-binding transcriptional ArsR family regulator